MPFAENFLFDVVCTLMISDCDVVNFFSRFQIAETIERVRKRWIFLADRLCHLQRSQPLTFSFFEIILCRFFFGVFFEVFPLFECLFLAHLWLLRLSLRHRRFSSAQLLTRRRWWRRRWWCAFHGNGFRFLWRRWFRAGTGHGGIAAN